MLLQNKMPKWSRTKINLNKTFQLALHKKTSITQNLSINTISAILSQIINTNSKNAGKRLNLYKSSTLNLGLTRIYSSNLDELLEETYLTLYKTDIKSIGSWTNASDEDLNESDSNKDEAEDSDNDDEDNDKNNSDSSDTDLEELNSPKLLTPEQVRNIRVSTDIDADSNKDEVVSSEDDDNDKNNSNSSDTYLEELNNPKLPTPEQVRNIRSTNDLDISSNNLEIDYNVSIDYNNHKLNKTITSLDVNQSDIDDENEEQQNMEVDEYLEKEGEGENSIKNKSSKIYENSIVDHSNSFSSFYSVAPKLLLDESRPMEIDEEEIDEEEIVYNNVTTRSKKSKSLERTRFVNVSKRKETRRIVSREIVWSPRQCSPPETSPLGLPLLHDSSRSLKSLNKSGPSYNISSQEGLCFMMQFDTNMPNKYIIECAKIKESKYEKWLEFNS